MIGVQLADVSTRCSSHPQGKKVITKLSTESLCFFFSTQLLQLRTMSLISFILNWFQCWAAAVGWRAWAAANVGSGVMSETAEWACTLSRCDIVQSGRRIERCSQDDLGTVWQLIGKWFANFHSGAWNLFKKLSVEYYIPYHSLSSRCWAPLLPCFVHNIIILYWYMYARADRHWDGLGLVEDRLTFWTSMGVSISYDSANSDGLNSGLLNV